MSEANQARNQTTALPMVELAEAERVQATLSIVGDVSVAASESMRRAGQPVPRAAWVTVPLFFLPVYALSVGLASLFFAAAGQRLAWLAPLFPALCAAAVFWSRQHWKSRARIRQYRFKSARDALDTLGRQTANSLNAIRANLVSLGMAHPELATEEHLAEIDSASRRIEAAIHKAANR